MNRLLVFPQRHGGLQRRDGKRERVERGLNAVVCEGEAKSVPMNGKKSELLASVEGRIDGGVEFGVEAREINPIRCYGDEKRKEHG